MTNKHVVQDLSRGTDVQQEGQAIVRFDWEDGSFAAGIERRIIGVGTLCAVPACLSQPARGRGRSLSADAMFTAGSRRTPAV